MRIGRLGRRELLLAGLAGCARDSAARIGVVPKATSHLFFVSIHRGVDAAAREFGVRVEWNGPREETEHTRQIQIVDAMVARRVDALAISATDERALAAPVERAIAAGIPVTVFDSGVNVEGYVSFIATDNHHAGGEAARLLAGLLGGRGDVAMLMHKPGGTSTNLREQGFAETLAREFPALRLAARQYGMSDAARARAAAENILTAQPSLAGLFASSEASSRGAIQAIKGRGLAGRVKLVTFDTSDAHVAALRDSTIDVMLVQDAFRLGYEAVRSLARKLRGETPERTVAIPARAIRRADLADPEVRRLVGATM
jgi:ribose transport system substrate-binding protein